MNDSSSAAAKGKEVMEEPPSEPAQAAQAKFVEYPKPTAKFEEVIGDANLFMATLEKLHANMSSRLRIPVIGGKHLDLHHLFKEVTSRGGYEKVTAEKRWKEVTATFNFPSTATNASFILRKYYGSLLNHYEQIYFFGSHGWNSPRPDSQVPRTALTPVGNVFSQPAALHYQTDASAQKRKRNTDETVPTYPSVVGVIDGKFDLGYFVTVTVGNKTMKGVVYHCPIQRSPHRLVSPEADNTNIARMGHCGRRGKKLRDPTRPKRNRSGYSFFFAEQHAKLRQLHPGRDREFSKMIGELWNKLSETEKSVYQAKALKDKERYKDEMVVYRENQKVGPSIGSPLPLEQRPFLSKGDIDPKGDDADLSISDENDSGSDEVDDFYRVLPDSDVDSETSREECADPMDSPPLPDKVAEVNSLELQKRETTADPKPDDIVPSLTIAQPGKVDEPPCEGPAVLQTEKDVELSDLKQ